MYPHLPLRVPRLYILHLLLVRVSVVIAHLRDRALFIHIGSTPRERPRPLYGEESRCIQDLLTEKTIKTSSRRRTDYLLHRPLLTLDGVSLFVFRGSSICVIVLVGLNDSLVFPLVFSLVFFVGSAPFMKDRNNSHPCLFRVQSTVQVAVLKTSKGRLPVVILRVGC